MSLINKMGINDSIESNIPHLNGITSRYYPSLWHANLLIISKISGSSIPAIWNAFTPWGALIKIASFYLLAIALTKNRNISFISAILFVLLSGVGSSYLRVSTWPSHISYTAMFASVYLAFHLVTQPIKQNNIKYFLTTFIQKQYLSLSLLTCSLVIVFYSHKSEILWLTISFMAYGIGISIHHLFQQPNVELDFWDKLIRYISALLFTLTLIFSIYFYTTKPTLDSSNLIVFIYTSICFVFIIALIITSLFQTQKLSRYLVTIFVVIIILGIDFKQLASLFLPELAYPSDKSWQYPVLKESFFNSYLQLPNWKLQLRAGLLFSGIFGIIASVILVLFKSNRASIFLASSAILSFFVLISPYWYHWLSTILNYHSPWRIAILIFHPIILALFLRTVWAKISTSSTKLKHLSLWAIFIVVTINCAYEAWNIHLNPKVIADKIQSGSAQKNWNIHYHRKNVINNGPLRYESSLKSIEAVVEPNSFVYADLSTSYYAAAYLPVLIKNIHSHHDLLAFRHFKKLKNDRDCYSNTKKWNKNLNEYLNFSRSRFNPKPLSNNRYLLVNHDKLNSQLNRSCFLRSLDILAQSNKNFAEKLYSDSLFTLYQLK